MTIGTTMSCTKTIGTRKMMTITTMMVITMTKMIGMTMGGTDPQLFHIIYWSVIAVACFIGLKLLRESDFH